MHLLLHAIHGVTKNSIESTRDLRRFKQYNVTLITPMLVISSEKAVWNIKIGKKLNNFGQKWKQFTEIRSLIFSIYLFANGGYVDLALCVACENQSIGDVPRSNVCDSLINLRCRNVWSKRIKCFIAWTSGASAWCYYEKSFDCSGKVMVLRGCFDIRPAMLLPCRESHELSRVWRKKWKTDLGFCRALITTSKPKKTKKSHLKRFQKSFERFTNF